MVSLFMSIVFIPEIVHMSSCLQCSENIRHSKKEDETAIEFSVRRFEEDNQRKCQQYCDEFIQPHPCIIKQSEY